MASRFPNSLIIMIWLEQEENNAIDLTKLYIHTFFQISFKNYIVRVHLENAMALVCIKAGGIKEEAIPERFECQFF